MMEINPKYNAGYGINGCINCKYNDGQVFGDMKKNGEIGICRNTSYRDACGHVQPVGCSSCGSCPLWEEK